MFPCRLIVDPPLDGAWNMAVDEALLEDAADRGSPTLRFYQWRRPTISLGYFQPYLQRRRHVSSQTAPLVRRLTGGGALVHDRELTYSLCLPRGHFLARESTGLYRVVHETLIAALSTWNVQAEMFGTASVSAPAAAGTASEPFLCFERRTDADVILSGIGTAGPASKIAGSAQRRRRGAVLQHGGVILGRSTAAPELAGLEELSQAAITAEELREAWQEELAKALRLDLTPARLDVSLARLAEELRTSKYESSTWTERR